VNEQDLVPLIGQAARRTGLDVIPSGHDVREWRLVSPDEDQDDTYVRLSGDGLEIEFLRSFSPFAGTSAIELSSSARAEMHARVAAAARAIDWRMTTTWSPADATAVVHRTFLSADVSVPAFEEVLSDLNDVVSVCRHEASAVLQGVAGPVPADDGRTEQAGHPPRRPGAPHEGAAVTSRDPGKAEVVPAILATVCCGCPPIGIVAIVFSQLASSHFAAGRIHQAEANARRARIAWVVALCFGLAVGALGMVGLIAGNM